MGFIAAWNPKTFGFVFIHREKCFVFVPVCKTICFMPSFSRGKTEMVLACWARQASCTWTDAPGPNLTQHLSTCVIFSFWPAHLEAGRRRWSLLGPVGILPLVSTGLGLHPTHKDERSLTVLARGESDKSWSHADQLPKQLIPCRPALGSCTLNANMPSSPQPSPHTPNDIWPLAPGNPPLPPHHRRACESWCHLLWDRWTCCPGTPGCLWWGNGPRWRWFRSTLGRCCRPTSAAHSLSRGWCWADSETLLSAAACWGPGAAAQGRFCHSPGSLERKGCLLGGSGTGE